MFESCRAHLAAQGTVRRPPNPGPVTDVPDTLTLRRHRDLIGRERRPMTRWIVLSALGLLCLLGLLNLFGQRPTTSTTTANGARLEVYSPSHLRGGLYYESRFTIHAQRDIKDANLVLGSGWLEGITVNTIEPSPLGEASRDGDLALDLGHVPASSTYVLYVQAQVNPTNIGHRETDVDLYDGDERLVHIDRTMTVFP
jgi:hypothetical protein